MNIHRNIYGYLNASLYDADCRKAAVETKKDLNFLGCFFESDPEEIAHKAYWDAYLDGRC